MKKCELYPVMITPFNENGEIDFESTERLIAMFEKNNCDGIFAVCQSSEMFFMTNEEMLKLASFCIKECHKRNMKCVVSGHTQNSICEQIDYLKKLETLKPDAIILISNRLAREWEDDKVLIDNLERLVKALEPETRLGIYECPYPYKRLLTKEVLEYVISTEHFDFIKDTCCNADTIAERNELIKGSCVKLYNANSATLKESLESGAVGYSGIALNFIPEVFAMLNEALENGRSADEIFNLIDVCSVYENQNYPWNVKFYQMSLGNIKCDYTRNYKAPLSSSQKREILSLIQHVKLVREVLSAKRDN